MPGDSRCLRVSQDAAYECQQLLQRVEVRRLPRDHMLDAPLPGEWVPWGLGTKLHHKGPIGRERQWELGHGRPPATPHPGRAFSRCPWPTRQGAVEKSCCMFLRRKIHDTICSRPYPQAFKCGGAMPRKRSKTVQAVAARDAMAQVRFMIIDDGVGM